MSEERKIHLAEINRVQLQRDKLAEEVIMLRRELETARGFLDRVLAACSPVTNFIQLREVAADVERWLLLSLRR